MHELYGERKRFYWAGETSSLTFPAIAETDVLMLPSSTGDAALSPTGELQLLHSYLHPHTHSPLAGLQFALHFHAKFLYGDRNNC